MIGIFRDVGAPKRLSILAEGESLFNDAVAIAAFGFFITFLCCARGRSAGRRPVGRRSDVANPLVAFAARVPGRPRRSASAWRAWPC